MTPISPDQLPENIREYSVCHTFDRDFINSLNKLHRQYGDEVFEVLGIANRNLDIARFSEEFFNKSTANVADVSVDDNANVSEKNISHYESESTKALQKLNSLATMYVWVKKCFSKKDADVALDKVMSGEVFVSDLTCFQKPYCFAFDLRNMLYEGMSFFKGNFKIHPPKRTSSFIAQLIQTIAYISNQIVGAAAFPSALIDLDYFLRKDYGNDYMEKIKEDSEMNCEITNHFQNFIYSVNYPFRGAGQSAFTNLSVLDRGFIKSLFTKEGVSGSDYLYPDGTTVNIESSLALSKFFFEYYTEINQKEGIFTFPVMTLAISIDDNGDYVDPEFVEWVGKANSEKCLGNVFINKPTSFSSCCRLLNNFENLSEIGYTNSFGVGSLSVGSHRVSGLNLPRISLLEKDNPNILDEALQTIHNILFAHRKMLEDSIAAGNMPLYSTNWISLKRQYSTVGFVGMFEYLKNKNLNPVEEKSILEGLKVLKHIENKMVEWQKADGCTFNLEQIPAESFAVRLAKLDTLLGYNPNDFQIYSNQYLPLWEDSSIYDRFKLQGKFDSHTTGGAILHINVQDSKPLSPRQFKALLEQARTSGTVYFAINLAFSECKNSHFTTGQQEKCPVCQEEIVNQYTRVVGYLSKVSAWNKTRRTLDYPNRHFYTNGKLAALGKEDEVVVKEA
jgi:ribonucleoside-triphosphate reductase